MVLENTFYNTEFQWNFQEEEVIIEYIDESCQNHTEENIIDNSELTEYQLNKDFTCTTDNIECGKVFLIIHKCL